MNDFILNAAGIKMAYQNKAVLQGCSLELRRGEVCGLLGANGAGKTTLLRILTGLTCPDGGEVRLFGKAYEPTLLRRCGCLVGSPALHGGKTVEENLRIHHMLLGAPAGRIPGLLKSVGLGEQAKRRAGGLSTGQKQRLGLAMALSGNPDLLILDEPAANLDAQGMYDIRTLLQELAADREVSILLTSHLLDEVARLATSYAILKGGLLTRYDAAQVRERSRQYAEIFTDNSEKAVIVLDEFTADGYEVQPDGSLHVYKCLEQLPEINAALVQAGMRVFSLSIKTQSLTDFYLDETGGGRHA